MALPVCTAPTQLAASHLIASLSLLRQYILNDRQSSRGDDALLDEFLTELREYPSLWNATAAECARYWLETFPPRAHLRLEPSIWQDYPGSFS